MTIYNNDNNKDNNKKMIIIKIITIIIIKIIITIITIAISPYLRTAPVAPMTEPARARGATASTKLPPRFQSRPTSAEHIKSRSSSGLLN